MRSTPTDLEFLECVYGMYAGAFAEFSREHPIRGAKTFVPTDIGAIAIKLKTDAHELFGRLHYNIDHRHAYKRDDGSSVHLFALQVGDDKHCINYPYLAGVLAEKRSEDRRNKWSLWISLISLGVAIAALVFGI